MKKKVLLIFLGAVALYFGFDWLHAYGQTLPESERNTAVIVLAIFSAAQMIKDKR